jgi:hypothetical protein
MGADKGYEDLINHLNGTASTGSLSGDAETASGLFGGASPASSERIFPGSNESRIKVEVTDPDRIKPSSADMGILQTIRFNMTKGNLTREHLLDCTELAFNTAFKHMALQCSLGLAEANQKAFYQYLEATVELRKGLFVSLRRELISIADEYFSMVQTVHRERTKWNGQLAQLKSDGHISEKELAEFKSKAEGTTRGIIEKCEEAASLMAATIENQMRAALTVKIEELVGISTQK